MNDGVLVVVDGRMKVLHRAGGGDDEMLRTMLEHRPELIVGAVTPGDPRRLLLVRHRAGATGRAAANGSSLERLFVDSDAVPVLVGVQLSSDEGAVGDELLRLLDRVALGIPRWRGGRLRGLARLTHGDRDEEEVLVQALGWRADPDTFWARAETNLANHRVHVVLVTDRLPDELLRVVELLDEQLRDIEVRAVEVCRYGSGPVQALVPRATRTTSEVHRGRHASRSSTTASWATDPLALEGAALQALLDPEGQVGVSVPGKHRLQD
jgi:hypothetical protein